MSSYTFRINGTLIPLNMDFDNLLCGACYKIIRETPISHKITKNEFLGNVVAEGINQCNQQPCNTIYQLHVQHYNDSTPFYYLSHEGRSKAGWGNTDKAKLIEDLILNYKERNGEHET
jgi:hypothetical protein